MKNAIKAQLENEYVRVTFLEFKELFEEGKINLLNRSHPSDLKLGDIIEYNGIKLQYNAGSLGSGVFRPDYEQHLELDLVK